MIVESVSKLKLMCDDKRQTEVVCYCQPLGHNCSETFKGHLNSLVIKVLECIRILIKALAR